MALVVVGWGTHSTGASGEVNLYSYRQPVLIKPLLDAFTAGSDLEKLVAASRGDDFAGIPLDGFDTFWYSWVAINSDSALLR